jgi:cytochrome c
MKLGLVLRAGAAAILFTAMSSALAAPVALDITDAGKKLSGDPVKGKQIFNRCAVCHSIKAGDNRVGPSLNGVVGRTAGQVPNFSYSSANKKSGIVWTQQKLFDYLKNPQMMVRGTKMMFPGLPKAQDRADVIAYLKQNSK